MATGPTRERFHGSLPDMADAVLSEHASFNGRRVLIQVSPVRKYGDYGPGFDVVHVCAVREDGVPLVLRDIHPHASRQAAYELWSFLCDELAAAAVLAYGLREDDGAPPNPRMGCWGPRPDLAASSVDDGATVLVIGVAIDTRSAAYPERHNLLALAVRSAVVAALRRCAAEARPKRPPDPRAN